MWKRFLLILFVTIPAFSGDVVFGRRVYSAQGKTYQQLWSLDRHSHRIAQLSNSERRHMQPACSPDGKRIWFLSGAFGQENNTELWAFDPATHTEKLTVSFTGNISKLLGGSDSRALFAGWEGDNLGLYRWDGKLTKLSTLSVAVQNPAALSPDAKSLAVQDGEGVLSMMDMSGLRGRIIENCAGPAWSSDGTKIACVDGKTIRVINLTTGIPAAHFEFNQRPSAPEVADYSADGTKLIVSTVGANHSSTFPQSDYWALEIATGKSTFIGPGQSAIFAPDGHVLLVTPRELAEVSKGKDWVSRMMVVDLGTHAQIPEGAGQAANADPCRCLVTGALAAPAAAKPVKSGVTTHTALVPLSRQHR